MPTVDVVQVKTTLSPSVGVALSALTVGVAGLSEDEREQAQHISSGLLQRNEHLLHTYIIQLGARKQAFRKQTSIQATRH